MMRTTTLAKSLRKDHIARPWVVHRDRLVRVEYRFGYCTVEFPEGTTFRRKRGKRLMGLIAVERPQIKDPTEPPMMLLCNRPVRNAAEARRWVEAYFRRWGVEGAPQVHGKEGSEMS